MIIRKKHLSGIIERIWETLADDEIILKQFRSYTSDGFLNAVTNNTYDLMKLSNCEVKVAKDEVQTSSGVKFEVDAVVCIGISVEIEERDIINIGGVISDEEIDGGDNFRIVHVDPFDDCTKLLLSRL